MSKSKKNIGVTIPKKEQATVPSNITPEEPITPLAGIHIVLMVAIIVVFNLLFFPARKSLFDHTPHWADAPALLIKDSIMERIQKEKPQVVLLGNSMVGRSVHPQYLNDLTKIPTLILAPGGSGSAWWYLAFKNMLCVQQVPTV